MDNLTLAGMLHVCLSIRWMRAQVPDSIVETNHAHSDSECRKTKKQDRNILLVPNTSFANKEKGTEICNRNSVICVSVPPILKRNISSFTKNFCSIYRTWQISNVFAFSYFSFPVLPPPHFPPLFLPLFLELLPSTCVAYLIRVAAGI